MTPEQTQLVESTYWRLDRWVRLFVAHCPHSITYDDLLGVAEEALVKAARRFNSERASFRTYADHCVFGAFREYCRQAGDNGKFRPTLEYPTDLALAATQDSDVAERELSDLLDKLPERLQFVLRRRFWYGETETEIGKFYGVSSARISQMQSEALGLLRTLLTRSARSRNALQAHG